MFIRFLTIIMFAVVLSGCATTSRTSPVNQMQIQMTEMRQRMEDQEKEIVDLKYEVKELTSKVEEQETTVDLDVPVPGARKESAPVLEPKSLDIIRVGITGRELQKALKIAGVYDGKIEGKVGPKTKAGVMEFQRTHGLKADGVVGQKTWNELKVYLEPSSGTAAKN